MGLDKEASSSSSRLDAAPLLPQHGLHGGGPGAGGHLSSQPKTFANVFIAVVGTGVLGLPYTFSRTGWAAGTLLLLAVAALTFHCMMLLVAARRRIADEDTKISSFGDLGHAIYGAPGRHAVDAMLVLSQVSFCVGYVIFISNTMAHLYPIGADSPASPLLTAKALFIWAMLPFQLGLNSIKTLTLLAPLSTFADVVDLGAMGVVLGQDASIWLANKPPVFAFAGPAELLYGLGVAVYAFEAIGMVLPLEAEAADKRRFGATLALSMAFIAVMYGLFGAMAHGLPRLRLRHAGHHHHQPRYRLALGPRAARPMHQPLLRHAGVDEPGLRGRGAPALRQALRLVAALDPRRGRRAPGDARAQLRRLHLARRQQRLRRALVRAARRLPPQGLRR
ncbi:unnamed protein product [Miscanthus lutarioriparius]|uniref:Amino acid transporter transmembrane domain-containing protein n=1 Tax=Miscanthus lutarioriparius TaxID=422564 RepID=A0A811QUV2_9POAL|nr:unnamed protein product [Miscanthus lutarioriparius]